MHLFSPLDPLLFVLYAAYKVRPLRWLILFFGLIPASLYSLPPQSCGCFSMPFVRCTYRGREAAYFAAMKSDLRSLRSQQEIHFSDTEGFFERPEVFFEADFRFAPDMLVVGKFQQFFQFKQPRRFLDIWLAVRFIIESLLA